ncbi:MAG: hypothetical protein WAO00_06090 [Chthoniobacterales bacterium]
MTQPASVQKQYVHESLFSQIAVLKRQIIAAQSAGFALIVVPAFLIGNQAKEYSILVVPIALITFIYFGLIYRDKLFRRRIPSFADRIQRYRSYLGGLIAADAIMCLGLIGLSGGFPDSHLTFVFLLIPCSVAFIRGGGRTLRYTVLAVIAIVITETAWQFPSSLIGEVFKRWGLTPVASRTSALYPVAVAFGIIIGVVLAWYQSFVAAGSSLSERMITGIVDGLRAAQLDLETVQALTSSVSKAYHHMSRTISLTNEPAVHCSLVHPLDDVVFQAYALAIPAKALVKNAGATMQAAAEVTFAAHWLDDAFDCLGYDRLTADHTSSREFDIRTMDTNALAEYYHPYGIRRVLVEIKARTHWAEGSESGLMRIICGGFIQGLEGKHRTAAVARVRSDVLRGISDKDLALVIERANEAFLWGITKSDMPLVLSIYLTGDHRVHAASVVLDALFMPLLVWHDLETELSRESVPMEGFENKGIKEELDEAVGLAVSCIEMELNHRRIDETISRAMRPVFELVYYQYDARLPRGGHYENYRDAVAAWLIDTK